MELYDEEIEQKKSKLPMVIGICIAILVAMMVLVIYAIIYLKSSITTINIDGKRNTQIEEIFYVKSTEEELKLYMPIIKIAKYFGYEAYTGDYTEKSEDKTKCHAIGKYEIAIFSKDSEVLVKINDNSEYEYITIDEPIFEKDGELYTTIDGIEKAFNVSFLCDEKMKNINIYSMDYLIQYWAKIFKIAEYSDNFTDQKAILQNMMIIQNNGLYGVFDIENQKNVLETKYDEITYLPVTTDFLVKSNGKYGIVTKDAKIKVRTVYDKIYTMDNKHGLYLVKQNNVYGVINTNGNLIIQPEYAQIGINIDEYYQNGVESPYILLDEIIPIQNDEGLWGFFNLKGEKITGFKYTGLGCKSSSETNSYPVLVIPSHKIIVVKKDKYFNLINSSGEELIQGDIIDSVYLKLNTETQQNQFFMTANNKVINVEQWLESNGR